MVPHQAVVDWQGRQQQILMDAYVKAWRTGASNYRSGAVTPLAGSSRPQPTAPAAQQMQQALQPALVSLAGVAAGAVMVVPTAAQVAAAGTAEAALRVAMVTYLLGRAYRLAGGASVVWAGEQAGYAQCAAADGQLLRWQLDPGVVNHCADCPALASLPPMPLDQWPTLPGMGATACQGGCKCSMVAAGAITPPVLTGAQVQTVQRVSAKVPVLVAA